MTSGRLRGLSVRLRPSVSVCVRLCPSVSVSVRLRPSPSVSVRLRPSPSVSVRARTTTPEAYVSSGSVRVVGSVRIVRKRTCRP